MCSASRTKLRTCDTTCLVRSPYLLCLFRPATGYRLPFLKGRIYGKEVKEGERLDGDRASRIEVVGKKEDCRGENCQEAEKDGRRYPPKGVQHRALARFPFLIFSQQCLYGLTAPACT